MKRKKKRRSRLANKQYRRWFILVVLLCVVLIAGGLYYVNKRLSHPKVEVDKNDYPICGIDVSNHNGIIDFDKVARDSISFVYIKASEGLQYIDPRFRENYKKARTTKLKIGAYHFFRKKKNGRLQAENFMRAVRGIRMDMPYVIDVEDWGDDLFVPENEAVGNLSEMVNWLKKYGVRIMIYTNKDGYRKYIKRDFAKEHLWICAFSHPSKTKSYNWHIQQYSHWGAVDGIEGEVDLNVFYGNTEQWETWLQE